MKRVLLCALALVVVLSASPASAARKGRARLAAFTDCGQLVSYAAKHRDRYTPGGPPSARTPMPTPVGVAGPTAGGEGGPVFAPAAPAGDAGGAGGDLSLTNNQEAGVFEPDIVKTNGKTLYALTSSGRLNVVDVTGAPAVVGSLDLGGYGHQMLYDGRSDRLLVMWTDTAGKTMLAYVDVGDPAKPVLERSLAVDGYVISARRTERTVRVVLGVTPPEYVDPAAADERRANAWLPRGDFTGRRGNTSERRLLGCRSVRHPKAFSGLEHLMVLTINFDKGLDPVDADSVMTGGETVYASAENLYVATQRYMPGVEERTAGPVPSTTTTLIHRFSLDDADNTTYRGSGTVRGFALNQFSLSEHDGVLRIATTDTPPWFFEGGDQSQSYVTTFGAEDGRLVQLGQVGGLGKGERIYAVRFLGDTGYVVTFRQVDPLYTLDLSDPAAPAVVGELKIPGFSSYLHPIAGDRVVGVGTGPDEQAGTQGLQVSLFDVSDLAAPKLERRVTFDGGSSEVATDHHAFLWWEPRQLAVLPVQTYETQDAPDMPACAPERPCPVSPMYYEPKAEAVGLTVKPEGIAEAGRIAHGKAIVRRSIVLGDRLLTVSDAGVAASSLDTWAEQGFAGFSAASGSATPPSP